MCHWVTYFRMCINDLPNVASSNILAFANDCIVYLFMPNPEANTMFGHMSMTANKSKLVFFRRRSLPRSFPDVINKTIAHLVVHLTKENSWATHTDFIMASANRTGTLLPQLRQIVYTLLVHPKLKNVPDMWYPHESYISSGLEPLTGSPSSFYNFLLLIPC